MVFFPSRRWSSRICLMAAANSEAGTTSSPAVIAVRAFLELFAPFEELVGVDVVQASDMRDGHTGSKVCCTMVIFFLRSPASTALGSC